MGQKIHPTGFRLAVARNWSSRWYAGNTNFAGMLNEDLKARAYLKKKLKKRIRRSGSYRTSGQKRTLYHLQLASRCRYR